MNIFATLTAWAQAIAAAFGYSKHRSELRNAPDIKAAAIAKQEQQQVDKTNKAVANQDIDQIRKDLAE